MGPTLPRLIRVYLLLAVACRHGDHPVPPGPPLPAEPDLEISTMDKECDAMLAALESWKTCPNNEDEDRQAIDGWIEIANMNFAASRKANPEPNARKAIAGACHKATNSVLAATARCQAGKRPRID